MMDKILQKCLSWLSWSLSRFWIPLLLILLPSNLSNIDQEKPVIPSIAELHQDFSHSYSTLKHLDDIAPSVTELHQKLSHSYSTLKHLDDIVPSKMTFLQFWEKLSTDVQTKHNDKLGQLILDLDKLKLSSNAIKLLQRQVSLLAYESTEKKAKKFSTLAKNLENIDKIVARNRFFPIYDKLMALRQIKSLDKMQQLSIQLIKEPNAIEQLEQIQQLLILFADESTGEEAKKYHHVAESIGAFTIFSQLKAIVIKKTKDKNKDEQVEQIYQLIKDNPNVAEQLEKILFRLADKNTGDRAKLERNLAEHLKSIRQLTSLPLYNKWITLLVKTKGEKEDGQLVMQLIKDNFDEAKQLEKVLFRVADESTGMPAKVYRNNAELLRDIRLILLKEKLINLPFWNEYRAYQTKDGKKFEQFILNNLKATHQYEQMLFILADENIELAEEYRNLAKSLRKARQELSLKSSPFWNELIAIKQAKYRNEELEKLRQLILNNSDAIRQFEQIVFQFVKENPEEWIQNYRHLAELFRETRLSLFLAKLSFGNELDEKLKQFIFNNPKTLELLDKMSFLFAKKNQGDQAKFLILVSQFFQDVGIEYTNLNQYQKALAYYQKALTIQNKADDQAGKATTLTKIATAYDDLAQYQYALEYYQYALKIQKQLGNQLGQLELLNHIGIIHRYFGQYQQALRCSQEILEIARKIDNKKYLAQGYTGMGRFHQYLGQQEQALDYYNQARKILREMGDKFQVALNLSNIGAVYINLDQYFLARSYHRQALKLYQAIEDKHNKRRYIGNSLTSIGNTYLSGHQYPQALDFYQQALEIKREIGDKLGTSRVLERIGVTYNFLGQYPKAKTSFQESIKILEELGVIAGMWQNKSALAFTETQLKQFDAAIEHYEQALDNIEKLRAEIKDKEHKLSFMRNKMQVYDKFIKLLQSRHLNHPNKHYDRKALEIFERKQGRVFLEEIAQSGARRFTTLPNDIIQQEQTLAYQWQKSLSLIERNVLENEQAQFEARLQKEYPKYYALKYPKPVDLVTLQNQVLQEGEMMLVYGVIEEIPEVELERKSKIILWIIGKDQFQMLPLSLKEDELIQQVKTFRDTLLSIYKVIENAGKIGLSEKEFPEKLKTKVEDTLPNVIEISHRLYQNLLPVKARQLLNKAQWLYVVPTGPLYGLPFEALVTNEDKETPHYLIQEVAIAYLSSASLLKTLRDTQTSNQIKASEPLLAFADPIYPACSEQQTIQRRSDNFLNLRTRAYQNIVGGCFKRLPETADEVTEIAQWLKAPVDKALKLREAASRETVLNTKLDNYRHVVFATHAVLPNETNTVTQPALVLSHQQPDENAYLTMADVFGLKLNADFVTLSACNTGQGEHIKGEGIRGLTRAFMYAGTPAVSVTLWAVESQSAKSLSTGMFKYLTQIPPNSSLQKEGMSLAKALQQAKLELIAGKGKVYESHPYFWAPFVIWGEGFSAR